MASISPKIKKLYDAKKEAGDNVGTLEEFNSWFLAKGEEGYKNRKSVFDDFHSAGADVGANFEEFAKRLGLKAVKPAVPGKTPAPQTAQAKGSTQTQPASGKRFDPNSTEARRMMAETMMMPLHGRETVANATQTMRKTSQKPFMQPYGRVQPDVMKVQYNEEEQAERTLDDFEQRLNDEYNGKDFSPVSEMAMATDPFLYLSVGIMPDEEKERYDAARELISDARTTMRAAKAEKDGTFFGGVGRGLRDKLLDFDTWAMGIPELSRGGRIYVAAKKFKEGKPLTDGEKMLLEAAAVSANANGVFQKKLGRGYKAGATIAEMLPFIAEMILNPASGAGSAISKRTSNYLLKKGGSALVNSVKGKVARVGSRVVGDIAGTGAMTATTGLPAVASGAFERHLGDAQYADVDGKLVYTGHEGGESWGEAIAKSFGEQMIERHSEMVGKYFSPVLSFLGGTAVKLIPGKARNFIEGVVNNTANANSVKLLRKFEKKAKWNGNIGEFAEEIVGGMENALVVGDQTIDTQEGTGVFNKDNLIDTFLVVSLFGGVVNGCKTAVAGYKIHKYIKAGKELDSIDAAMSSDEKTSAKWNTIKPVLERSSIDGDMVAMGSALRDVLSDENFDTEARKKVVSYVNDLLVRKGFGIGSEAASDETTDEETDANKSFADGYAATEGTDMEDAKNAYEIQRQRAVDVLGEEYVNGIDNGGMIPTLTTDEEKKAYDDYLNAKATYDGVLQHARDEIDSRAAESHAAIDSHVNKDTGTIIPATLKDDRHVYVVNGNVAVNDDGRIDIENSDESIIIVDAETGKTDFVSPAMFLSVDEAIDPEQEKEETLNAIAESVADEFSSKIDGTLSFNIGDTYNVMDDIGSPWSVQILADNGDGTVTVAWNGNAENPQEYVPKEFIQRLSRNAALARTQEQIGQRVIDEETMPKAYGINDEITLYAEDGKPYSATIVSDESEDGLYDVQLEDGRFVQYSAQQLDEMTASPLEYEDAEAMPQQTEPAGDATEVSEGDTMPMIDGEPDYGAVTPVRTHEYLYNESGLDEETASQFVKNKANAAAKALETLNKKKPKIGTSIAEYNRQMSAWSTKAEEAEAEAAYWKSVKDEHDKVIARRMAEQHERDLAATAQAQAEEDAYRAEQEAKAAEQAALGTNNVAPSIREKWSNAPKVEGAQDEIVLPNGEKVEGRYYLVESGAASASHDSNNGFAKTEGFPVDENGGSVNDRDYERDKDAQQVTRDIAAGYDSRAVQTPVVVSQDGVVLSGNGRTMAGELAAANGTDAAYNGYVASHPTRWGFTEEQVRGMQHPRVVFVPDASMPYTAETFAKFNQQEMKGQSKTEQAVKLGKVVSDGAFNRIIRIVNRFDTLGDFYADKNATAEALAELQKDGAISQAQVAELFDGDGISAVGKELLENTLIGKAFESNADAVREITEYKSMRQSIITALAEISNNLGLGEEYSLESELAQAIDLVYKARKAGVNHGEPASMFARQQNFDFYGMGETVADYTNATVMMIADILNDTRSSRLKKYMQVYNSLARDAANGQMDLFSGDVKSKEDIIDEVKQLFNYGTEEEQSKATQEAVARRKAESVQENGTVANGSEAEPAGEVTTDGENFGTFDPRSMSDEERQRRGDMLRSAIPVDVASNQITSTPEKSARKVAEEWWDNNIGESKWYNTEIGDVEINRNSVESSLSHGYGQMKLDAITSLVDGFSNAVYLGTMQDSTRQKGVLDHYFAYPINYKGERCYVFCRALQDNNTNRMYVHEVFIADNIKKGNTLQTAASQPHGGIALYRDILANVLDITSNESAGKSTQNFSSDQGKLQENNGKDAKYDQTATETLPFGGEGVQNTSSTNPSAAGLDAKLSYVRQYLVEMDGTTELADMMSEEEIDFFLDLMNAWEDANEEYGRVAQYFEPELKSKDKAAVEYAKARIDGAQSHADSIFADVERYYNNLCEAYDIEREDAETPTADATGTVADAIADAEAATETNPTDAQKKAGNYKKGHVKVDGFDITIENAKGSTRSGKDADGKEWSVTMNNTYGYIRGTEGVDGDHIDIYLSDNPSNGNVFVIDQVKADGTFDEHKVMYGFASAEEARDNYLANYSEGWTGLGTISEVTKDEFKKWIESSHRKTKPFADYKNVKVEGAQNEAAEDVVTPAAENTDNQGNPLKEDVTLKLEKVNFSDELDENGRQFVLTKSGEIEFGRINEDSGLTPAPILLSEGLITNPDTNDGYGLVHIEARHGDQIRKAGYSSVVEFIEEIAKNYETIRRGNTREGNETYLLQLTDKHDNTLIVELSNDGTYWNVNTAGVFKTSYGAKKEVVYSRHTTANQSAEADGQSQGVEQGGTQSPSSMLQSPAPNISGGKITNKSVTGQKKSDKSEEKAPRQKPTMTWRYYVETDDKGRVTLKREAIRNGQPPIGDGRFGVQLPTYGTLVEWLREGGRTDVLEQLGEDVSPAAEEHVEGTKKKTRGFLNEAETAELEKLKAQMRDALKKNRGNLTMGGGMLTNEGAEALTIGIKMGYLYVKSGVRQFNEFATTLIAEIGEDVRPLLKSIYNAVRDYPGAEEFEEEMTSYDEVRKANIAEIGQPQNVFDAAETIAQESEMERSAMTDEQLLESMSSNDANDSDFFTEEYDNRHSGEYNEEVDRYSAMLHENSTSKEDAEEMQAEALKQWINGAYKSAERTSVMAQIDALSDYLNAFETKEYSGNTVNTDEQGNPLNDDGTLKLEKISSIDELTDEDFSSPTRSVELPALKKNVDEAIGANGKPVIIKKNIFEKNWENHKFPFNESRSILKAALYETDLVGQTQPSTKPMHWVAIKIDEKSPIVILEVNEGKDNTEIVGWYTLDERNLERIKRQANKNGGELVILSSKDKVGSLSTPLIGLSSGGKSTNKSVTGQTKNDKSADKNTSVDSNSQVAERIEDVGEKIGGARKDATLNYAGKINLEENTPSKIFPRPNFTQLEKSGVPHETLVKLKAYYTAFQTINRVKRDRYKSQRLMGARFYASVAREMLLRDVDVYNESADGIVLTDYGKERLSLLLACIEALDKTGRSDFFDLDISDVDINAGTFKEDERGYYEGADGKRYVSTYGSSGIYMATCGKKVFDISDTASLAEEYCKQVEASHSRQIKNEVKFHVYSRRDGSCFIRAKVKGVSDEIELDYEFASAKEAFNYIKDNDAPLRAEAQTKADEIKNSRKKPGGAKSPSNDDLERAIREVAISKRIGKDYREGKDVAADDFMRQFGFRGVEFGNWANQKERQHHLNACYDALMDLAGLLDITPKAISLGGKLAFAFGARGHSSALAHYEPAKNVINLTKNGGAGCVAHEWFHALDNYFGGGAFTLNMKSAVEGKRIEGMRDEIQRLFLELGTALYHSDMKIRSAKVGNADYWASLTEMGARAFESYVDARLSERGQRNSYLSAHISGEGVKYESLSKNDPYPNVEEGKKFGEIFDRLFGSIQEKVDEEGNTILFQQAEFEPFIDNTSSEAILATETIIDALKANAGIDVVMETQKAGQKVVEKSYAEMSKRKKRALETASVISEETHQPTAVSSADGAKVLKNLETLKQDFEKLSNSPKFFIGTLAEKLGATNFGSKSKYASFETANGKIVTIRLSNHNASTSTFDNNDEDEGISIVISPKSNEGINNDGNAHIVEFFYNSIRLRRAEGKPLVSIINSIQQALYSGEYTDTTGIAEREEVNRAEFSISGERTATAQQRSALMKAKNMLEEGKSMQDVKRQTGWEIGADGKWKLEIPDFKPAISHLNKYNYSLKDLLKGSEIFRFYDLREMPVIISYKNGIDKVQGAFVESKFKGYNYRSIQIDVPIKKIWNKDHTSYSEKYGEVEMKEIYPVLLHEVQHELQRLNGFAQGGSGSNQNYRELAGEVEARNVMTRIGMSDEERRSTLLEDTEDVPRDRQRIEFMRVWHGSAAVFDHFDSSHWLEGEGSMAYGAGHYVTDNSGTGEMYAGISVESSQVRQSHREMLMHQIEEAKKNGWTWRIPVLEEELSTIPDADVQSNRQLYSIEIPDDNGSNYIGWNDKVSPEESRRIGDEVYRRMIETDTEGLYEGNAAETLRKEVSGSFAYDHIGYSLYGTVSSYLGSDVEASGLLSELGYVGIKVPTGNMQGGDGRGMNYVVFKDSDLKIKELIELMERPDGTVYGWSEGNRIHLTPEGINPNTPIHEYTHLWAKAVQQNAPELWNNIKDLLRGTPVWDEVVADKAYSNLDGEDQIASEALARMSGRDNAKRMTEKAREIIDAAKKEGIFAEAEARTLVQRMRDALMKFWKWVGTNLFDIERFDNVSEVTDRVLYDLANKTDLELDADPGNNGGSPDFQIVTDKDTIAQLEASPKITGYRNVALHPDGKMGSPMASSLRSSGKGKVKTGSFELGKWEQAEEHPEIAKEVKRADGSTAYKVDLVKPDEKTVGSVDYNPYIHNRPNMVNKQFKQAWERPELVYIETEIPTDDLSSGYHAEKAAKSVGVHAWPTPSSSQSLILSRYDKPLRIVPWEEVADDWEAEFGERGVEFDIIPPALLPILSERGVKILPPHKGMGEACEKAYREFSEKLRQERRSAGTSRDVLMRDAADYYSGEVLPIEERGGEYRVAGLNADYPGKESLIDAFKDKYTEYIVTVSEDGNSIEVSPWEVALKDSERNNSTNRARAAYVERKTRRAMSLIEDTAKKLGLNVEVLTTTEGLTGRRARSKGWYDPFSGKITVVLPNHVNGGDVMRTLLHEGVGHHGLRQMFGDDFSVFLDNVYANLEYGTRKRIVGIAAMNGWDIHVATEEYLAGLAEDTDFERAVNQRWWTKIRNLFIDLLRKAGINIGYISDDDLRYILWRSYQHLKEDAITTSAEDVLMQQKLGVGRFAKVADSGADGLLYRDGTPMDERDKKIVRERYERTIRSSAFQFREAMQDSMLSVRRLMESIADKDIEDIDGFENTYWYENRLSSINRDESDTYKNQLFTPLMDELRHLSGNRGNRDEVTDYMMAKHGLERNEVMARREAEKQAREEYADELRQAQKAADDDPLDWEAQDKLDETKKSIQKLADELYEKNREKDYGGITGLMDEEDLATAEAMARELVEKFESEHDTERLWALTSTCTKYSLVKMYKSGILSKSAYEDIRDMYEYYIPLRGFDEKTSDEVYAYLMSERSGFSPVIKKAKGRGSKADDPIATIATMAENAIMQGNRNLMKQTFLKFVMNHPSDAVSVNKMWLQRNDVTGEWEVVTAKIGETDSPDEVARKTAEFEERMEALSKKEPKRYMRGKDTINIPFKTLGKNLNEHQIHVRIGNQDYIITINGSPRAAQAVNGLTNPDADISGSIGAIMKAGEFVNRNLSALYTTRSPEFILSNFLRDALYANSTMWVKESPRYAWKFNKNFASIRPDVVYRLLRKYKKGTLDMENEKERAFYQFMKNGGETGYTSVQDIEKKKKLIKKYVRMKDATIPVELAWNLLGEKLDDINRAVENCARFSAFLTSRQMGRTIERSVWDAKEVSVNFNKKGAGSTFMGKEGQTFIGNAGAFTSGLGRSFYVFWNAAVQGTTNFGRLHKRHTVKALTMDATLFLLGAVMSGCVGGDDDDYWNLQTYVRRNNICFKIPGTHAFIKIPLGIEQRAIYGLGELFSSLASGRERMTGEEIAMEIAGTMSSLLPLDLMESNGNISWVSVVPTYFKPIAEALANRDWKGMPIYKDTPFNKYDPEWTKASKRTNENLVAFTKWLNEVSGGDDVTRGIINLNPSLIEHVFEGFGGGVATTINKLVKMGKTAVGTQEFDWSNILMASRIIQSSDDRAESRSISKEFWKYKGEYDETKHRVNGYENMADDGVEGSEEKLNAFYDSPEYGRYEIIDEYYPDIKVIGDELKETVDEAEKDVLQAERDSLMRAAVEEVRAFDDSRK